MRYFKILLGLALILTSVYHGIFLYEEILYSTPPYEEAAIIAAYLVASLQAMGGALLFGMGVTGD